MDITKIVGTGSTAITTTLIDQTFSSEAAAETYFSDDVLDLGNASGTFELNLSLTLTDDPAGDGFSTQILAGEQVQAAPEPSIWTMLVLGVLGLLWRVHSRRKAKVRA